MDTTVSIQEIEKLRREFRAFLREDHPDWSESNLSMHSSDSFYAFNNNVGIDFWSCFISDEAMLEVYDRIRDFLSMEKQVGLLAPHKSYCNLSKKEN